MSGRGRGATLPAWMTSSDQQDSNLNINRTSAVHHNANGQFDDFTPIHSTANRSSAVATTENSTRERRRSSSRNNDEARRKRSRSPPVAVSTWIPRKNKGSNFDVKPPVGVELPPIGVITPVNGIPNSFLSYANNPITGQFASGSDADGRSRDKADQNTAMMLTRHARRIYAGGIPSKATEGEIQAFFNETIIKALTPVQLDFPPVLKVYWNVEKCYAFVEFNSIELTTACMQLDGVRFDHYSGSSILRVRRPNDYRPETLPVESVSRVPVFNLNTIGGTMSQGSYGGGVGVGGPGKIFIGGLPYNLADEQIMELLAAFGPIKSFHQVRDPGCVTSKGYAFCEYMDQSVAETAISGLNGLQLGDKSLSVRFASASNTVVQPSPVESGFNSSSTSNLGAQMPTKVLQLSNMVTHEDLLNDTEVEDIKEDVRLECAEHGQVLRVIIPRVKSGYPSSLEGLIFVEFFDAKSATSAAGVLNGRKFADKTVGVSYFNESEFARLFGQIPATS